MAWTSSSVNYSALAWCLLLLLCTSRGSAQLSVVTVDTNQPLNASRIVVGTASDLALQVRCISTSTSTISWSNEDGSTVSQGLNPFGISQEDGILRVYPVTLLTEGTNTFSCSDGGLETLAVQFDRRPHLFFTSPIPEQAPASTNVTSLCPVPDIPAATVTVETDPTGLFSYCQVVTERGTFRSRSIITEEEVPRFEYEPLDLESNVNSRAAFSCAVLGIKPVVSIQWYFEMVQLGSGMGIMSGMLTSGVDTVTISSGTDVISTRASVLLLENVDSQHEGLYRCVVTFTDGQTLSSRNASLTFNATPAVEESIILAPPSELNVLEGNALFVPCVSSGPSQPSFSRVVSGLIMTELVTQLGLEMGDAAIADSGVYTCTVGGMTADVMVTVTPSLFPPDTATVFRIPSFAVPPERIVTDSLATGIRCVSSIIVNLQFLMDANSIFSMLGTALFRGDLSTPGFYQCASSRTSGSTNLYASEEETVYFLRAFLTTSLTPAVAITRPPTGSISINLTCTTDANPLPRFSWTVNNLPRSDGVQAITGFMVTASSILTVSTADLSLGLNSVSCTASLDPPVVVGPETRNTIVTVQAVPIITSPPMSLTVLAREKAVLNCSVEGFPLPTVSWVMLQDNGNEKSLIAEDSFDIAETNTQSTVTSTLTVISSDITLNGVYRCMANNTLGAVNETAQLIVNRSPIIATPPDLTVLAPEAAVLICSVVGFPLPMVSWVMVDNDGNQRPVTAEESVAITETNTSISLTSNLTISPTDIRRSGLYVCVATNEFGMANESALLTVNAVPIITSPPMDLTVVAPGMAVFNCIVEGFPLPTISWVMVDDDGNQITLTSEGSFNITEINETNSASSRDGNLIISRTDLTLKGVYVCVAINEVGSINASAVLTVIVPPLFLMSPVEEVLVIEGELVTLNCTAEGHPLPAITWAITTTIDPINTDFNITPSNFDRFTRTSVLSFIATETDPLRANGSMPYCIADNSIGMGIESNRTLVTIAGPPLPPNITVLPAARFVTVSWSTPSSLLPITNYLVNISESLSGAVTIETIAADTLYYNATSLTPNLQYNVSVVALSGAGASSVTTEPFYTLEDVPDGFPSNLRSSSTLLNGIDVSWNPLADNETNGVITGYTVQFRILSQDMTTEFISTTSLTATLNIEAGSTYRISVAARTAIGLGPYSTEISQLTLPEPPTFSPDPPPVVGSPGSSTISIKLPSVSGGTFSHYWVVVIRLDDASTFDESGDPSSVYPDNNSFINYSANIPPLRPYIAAEIRSDNYVPLTDFTLGDDTGTRGINDFPDRYRNGPLEQGSTYTAFVRAFSRIVPAGTRARRQNMNRQYTVFTSSPFVAPVGTPVSRSALLTSGAIAGIALAIILTFIAVVTIIIVSVILYERQRHRKVYGLPQPPSRKGSVRIRDVREIIPTATTLKNLKATAELQNLDPEESRNSVLVEDFPRYVKSMHANTDHLFSEEYEILSIKSPSLAHVQSSLPCNVIKNRYANINCFDDTRVRLHPIPGVDGSDYINANYIDGFLEKRGYVATQGPLAHTTQDFWRMVWEQKSCCIIMLTNVVEKNRAKCHQYWPEVGSLTMEDISVTLIEIQQLAYYTVRTFRMSRGNDRREVKQFHYTGWPDFGVPDYPHPVIAFSNRINDFKRTTPGPFIYHCSAGVGRTGTLMTIQAMMQMMEEEGKLDIFNFVLGLRHQRNYMVQTERQYIFIHDCIHEIMKVGETSIPIQTLRRRHKELLAHDPRMGTSKMDAEYARLNELQVWEESQLQPARMPVNKPKNRFEDILPYDRYRVRLLLHPGVIGSDYVNASYIDGYQHRHQYILTQGAMKHTVTDFWRMMWEHRVSCILMLCPLEEKGKEQCVRYWPTEKIIQQGDMFIELTQMTDYGSYTMREFSVTNTKINESRVIKHYQYSDWLEDTMPTNAATVIDLIGVLQKSQHMLGGGPIVVHDSSSIGRSATFCILGSILEQLKVEGIVDLFATIHSLRHQQPGLVNSFELYKFCYQAVLEFLDSFDHYANFD